MLTPPGGDAAAAEIQMAHKITNERLRKSKTVRLLSDQTGISYPLLCQSLSGDRSFSFNEIGRIAQALEVPPFQLLPETFRGVAA